MFDLNALIVDLTKVLQRLIREDIALVAHLDTEPATIKADPGEIEQVVTNVV